MRALLASTGGAAQGTFHMYIGVVRSREIRLFAGQAGRRSRSMTARCTGHVRGCQRRSALHDTSQWHHR